MRWKPWEDYKTKNNIDLLPITAPPCAQCEHFQPQRVYTKRGVFDGVVICTVETMLRDFSCYREKEKVAT
jgi:hypothetical protein